MRQARGFSLLEVLVAILLVSTGVLGVAGLQVISMKNNTSALFRTQASQLAYDIIDRLRANSEGAYLIDIADDAPAAQDCMNQNCTVDEMTDYDLSQWLGEVATSLPSGDAEVTVIGSLLTVRVQWKESRSGGGAPVSVSVTTALKQE